MTGEAIVNAGPGVTLERQPSNVVTLCGNGDQRGLCATHMPKWHKRNGCYLNEASGQGVKVHVLIDRVGSEKMDDDLVASMADSATGGHR